VSALSELRVAARSLARVPTFTALAVVVLGLGVAVVVVMYGTVQTVWSPPPVEDVERLVQLAIHDVPHGWPDENVTLEDLRRWRRGQSTFEDVAGCYPGTVMIRGAGAAERYSGGVVTGPFFELSRERPVLGRLLTDDDARPGAAPVVVLGERLWRERFGGSPDVVGTTLRVNGEVAAVVGVARAAFEVPPSAQLWIADRTPEAPVDRNAGALYKGVARLRRGVSLAAAQADLAAVQARAAEREPALAGLVPDVRPAKFALMGRQDEALFDALFASSFLVLGLAVVNVAGLLLVRAAGRTHEAAVRRALGAGRWRLALEMLAESAVVGALAALVGLTLAAAGIEALSRLVPPAVPNMPSWWDFRVHPRIVAFAVGAAAAGALAAGAYPALRASGVAIEPLLREGVRDTSASTGRLVRWLVVAEIALSCALLTTAGILARTAYQRAWGDLGADLGGLLGGRLALLGPTYAEERQVAFAEQLEGRLQALPGVEAAAVVDAPPGRDPGTSRYELGDRTYRSPADYPTAKVVRAGPRFFEAFRVPLREGRLFGAQDRRGAVPAAIVSETFARTVWPGRSAIGMRLRAEPEAADSPWLTVVGVVRDVQHSTGLDTWRMRPTIYLPFAQRPARYFTAVVRGGGDPLALADPLREAVRGLDPELAVYWLSTVEASRRLEAGGIILIAGMFVVFALVTLALAAAGIYGVLAFSVAQGARELAIRRALGASGREVATALARRSAWQLGIGLLLGLVASPLMATALGRAMGGSTHDPLVYACVVATLAAAISAATAVPLRRALAVDPARTLRHT
jgi:putative ABC transport system permease protein